MSETLTDLYRNLCHADKNMSATMLTRVWEHAVETGDHQLAATVAAHPNLPDTLTESVDAHPSAAVQIAWITRPDMTVERAVSKIDNEKRVTVLAAIASIEALHPEVLERLADRNHPRIAVALAHHPQLTETAALKAVDTLVEAVNTTRTNMYKHQGAVRAILTSRPTIIVPFVEKHPKTALNFLHNRADLVSTLNDPDGKVAQLLIDRIKAQISSNQTGRWEMGSRTRMLAIALRTVTNMTVREAARDLAQQLPALNVNVGVKELNDAINAGPVEAPDDRVSQALQTGNISHILEAVQGLNPRTDQDLIIKLCSSARITGVPQPAVRLFEHILSYGNEYYDLTRTVVNNTPNFAGAFNDLHNPQQLAAAIRLLTDDETVVAARTTLSILLTRHGITDTDVIAHCWHKHTMLGPPATRAAYGKLLEERLQTREAWELYATFTESSEGTIEENLGLVDATTS